MIYKNSQGEHHKETGGRGLVKGILNAYYGNRMFMLSLCACSEVFYLLLFVKHGGGGRSEILDAAVWGTGIGWGIKQVTNVAQIAEAARKLDR
jgi:hypothetical protein